MLDKIHVLEYDPHRRSGNALQRRIVGNTAEPITASRTSVDRAESNASPDLSRSPQRFILMDVDPLRRSYGPLGSSEDSIVARLRPLSLPKEMISWLETKATPHLLRRFPRAVRAGDTFPFDLELQSGYKAIMIRWTRPCGHESQEDDCLYLSSDCSKHRCRRHFNSTLGANMMVAAILQTPNSLVILFGGHCDSQLRKRELLSPMLSQKIMALREQIHSDGLLPNLALDQLCWTIIQDERLVISQLQASLIHINEDVGNEALLREGAKQWQQQLGLWRVHVYAMRSFNKCYQRLLDAAPPSDSVRDEAEFVQLSEQKKFLRQAQDEFEAEVKHVRELLESTFNAIMQTLSIIESQKAICEAEYVTRLTQLAFFFIPLSYVAGVCGMNIAEFGDGSLKAWIWAVTSVGVLATTYLLFYYTDISENVVSPLRARIMKRRDRSKSANTKNEAATA